MKKKKTIIKIIPYIFMTVLFTINSFLSFLIFQNYSREIIDVSFFTDYYESDVKDNGGAIVLEDTFYTVSKEYTFSTTEKKQLEKINVKINKYKIKQGDTLSKIAKNFGVNVDTIKLNNLNNKSVQQGKVKPGDVIEIPSVNGFFYKVKKGEFLIKIANKYGVKMTDITAYNDVEPKKIREGTEIFLKDVSLSKYKSVNKPKPKKAVSYPSKNQNVDNDNYDNSNSDSMFSFPVRYQGVASSFGKRFHPILKKYILHTGVDLVAKFVPLRAAADGVVTFAGYMSGYGKIIIIKHANSYETRYAHLQLISTNVGEKVKKGDLIGKTGNTGRVTGPHLHFEIRKNGVPKNPMRYLR